MKMYNIDNKSLEQILKSLRFSKHAQLNRYAAQRNITFINELPEIENQILRSS